MQRLLCISAVPPAFQAFPVAFCLRSTISLDLFLLPSETGKNIAEAAIPLRKLESECNSQSWRQLKYIVQSDWSEPFIKIFSADREVISVSYLLAVVVNKSSTLF